MIFFTVHFSHPLPFLKFSQIFELTNKIYLNNQCKNDWELVTVLACFFFFNVFCLIKPQPFYTPTRIISNASYYLSIDIKDEFVQCLRPTHKVEKLTEEIN